MDSGSILLANLGWGQFHQQSIQSAASLGSMGGAQSLAGGLMSQGMATGAPLMGGMAGMMGLDPLSMGLRAGSMAWRGGAGVMGAGMAGMGAMAGVGVLGAGAAWAGGQMLSGAQQQMGFNRSMGRNFNFQNTSGGQGFTENQGFRMGEDVRAMTHEFGKGGEVTSFAELSRLATNMGRMGMGQNVRTVKEFKDKFKQMVESVKTIATELGTSLEEAQKMMASMKQTGIFKPGQAVGAAHAMRATSLSGGLAMSEVSSMMNIGSQISRSVGGLGRAGAMGGMRTIGQVGTATQIGALSEEDIYNATGLTGAEGRQAFSTEMMSRSAQFVKSKRGRRFLASVAGANGELDEASAMEWMTGGVGTGRTMQMAHKNLAGVGRANFIRNEGRLRGAALERFGGMLQPMVYKQWLSQRGYDPNEMNDMGMLAFQRFSGLGRDEAEASLKVVNKLPEIMRSQSISESRMGISDLRARKGKTSGIEGMKRELGQMRERAQSKLQQWGADLLEEGTTELASFFNKMTGMYEEQTNEAVTSFVTAMRSGGAMSSQMDLRFKKLFGGAAGLGMKGAAPGGAAGAQMSGTQKYHQDLTNQLSAISKAEVTDTDRQYMASGDNEAAFRDWMTNKGGRMQGEDRIAGVQSYLKKRAASGNKEDIKMYERFRSGSSTQKAALTARLEKSAEISDEMGVGVGLQDQADKAALKAIGGGEYATVADAQEAAGRKLLGDRDKWYGKAASYGAAAVLGVPLGLMAMGEAIGDLVTGGQGRSDVSEGLLVSGAKAFGSWVSGADKEYRQAGVLAQDADFRANVAALASGKGDGFRQAQDRLMSLRARGDKVTEGTTDYTEMMLLGKASAVNVIDKELAKRGLKKLDDLKDPAQRELLLSKVREASGDDSVTLENIGKFSDDARGMMDEQSLKAAKQALTEIRSSQDFERGRYEKMGVAQYKKVRTAMSFVPTNPAAQKLKRELESKAREAGAKTPEEVEKFFMEHGPAGKGGKDAAAWEEAGFSVETEEVKGDMEITAKTMDKLKTEMTKAGGKDAVTKGQEAARLAMAVTNVDFSKGDARTNVDTLRKATAARDQHFAGMSVEQKRAFARTMAGTEAGEAMAVSLSQHERFKGLQKAQARRGLRGEAAEYGAAAGMLGLDLSKDEANALTGKGAGAAAEQVTAMLRKAGLSDDVLKTKEGKDFQDDVKKAMGLAKEGKTGEAASLLGAARASAPEAIVEALDKAETKKAARAGDPTAKIVAAIDKLPGAIAGLINKAKPDGDTPTPPGG